MADLKPLLLIILRAWAFSTSKPTGFPADASNNKKKKYNIQHHETSAMPTTTKAVRGCILSIRSLFLLALLSFAVLWFEYTVRDVQGDLVDEVLEDVSKDFRYYELYRLVDSLPKKFMFVLLWTSNDYSPFYELAIGTRLFIRSNCSVTNCYVTSDRNLFGGDITKFDAIAFNGRNINDKSWNKHLDLPKLRSPHQKYIFVMTESADNYPVCDEVYDNFFNWTYTYRLSSTLGNGYILIKNKYGEVVGPRKDMKWINMSDIDEKLPYVHNKSKAVAWFVSNCNDRSKRGDFVKKLRNALAIYGLTIDVYGACGTLDCPTQHMSTCYKMLEKDYYFYLALENSFDEDYVTEKVLTAINNNVVPIVYGGANYTRFLPPNSYLDARRQTSEQLAAVIAEAIKSKEVYQRFFWWKRHYTFTNNSNWFCTLCSALHNSSLINQTSVYEQFRRYCHPNYEKRCAE